MRQSDQNLSLASRLGDVEYDAQLGLSARQREQLVPQNMPAVPGPLRCDRQMRLQRSSMGDAAIAPDGEGVNGLPSPSLGVSASA